MTLIHFNNNIDLTYK